ncbi:hypothetical protein COOONC_18493 [Cooperia oncophora]
MKTSSDRDDMVVLDECGEGDETVESEDKSKGETNESAKLAGEQVQITLGPKKKQKIFRRKVVRVPKEVFDFMARTEEDGTVRFNVTQLSVFFTNEMSEKAVPVLADTWDTTDIVPIMDVSVPPTAKANPAMIVDYFSNEPSEREKEEERLQDILETRKRNAEKQKQLEAAIASGAVVLPAKSNADKKANINTKKPPVKAAEQMVKTGTDRAILVVGCEKGH